MKYLLLYITAMVFLLTACKKENTPSSDETTPDSNAPAYRITAPSCLIETYRSAGLLGRNYYDKQNRLIMNCGHQHINGKVDSLVSTYTYGNNTITEVTRTVPQSGSETVKTYIHYLNNMGLVDSIVGELFPFYTSRHYVYDNQGYLLRQLYYTEDQMSSGISFQYSKGNIIAIYQLNIDSETGSIVDSNLSNGFTYYTDLPGKLDASWAWNERTGRANTNARRDVLNSVSDPVVTYSYINENELPIQRNSTYGGNSYYTWKCN